jgi:hypothetical protein
MTATSGEASGDKMGPGRSSYFLDSDNRGRDNGQGTYAQLSAGTPWSAPRRAALTDDLSTMPSQANRRSAGHFCTDRRVRISDFDTRPRSTTRLQIHVKQAL